MDHGRVSAARLRLYHSMYQLFITTMLIALTTNNMGLGVVAMEAATLSTVLLARLYRTPRVLEAVEVFHPMWAWGIFNWHSSARYCCTLPPRKSWERRGLRGSCGRI